MASFSSHSSFLAFGVACSHSSLSGHNLQMGFDGSFYRKKLGFADNICVLKLESLVL
eukprot:c22184_g2_i1 orf=2-169(-)